MAGKIEVGLDELLVNSALREEAVFNIRVTDFRYEKIYLKTCSCPFVLVYFGTLFWDDITIFRDENLL